MLEGIFAESSDEAGLAHAAVSNYYHLRHIIVLIALLRRLHPPNYNQRHRLPASIQTIDQNETLLCMA
jgi:hypothetical protein